MNQEKMKIKSNLIMLIVSLLLTVAVCCAASYAWFYQNSTSRATAEMQVVKFDFNTNGVFNGTIDLSPGVPMYPGKNFTIELKFTNGDSNKVTPAIFDLHVDDISECPSNMIWKFGTNSDGVSNTDVTSKVLAKQDLITGATMNAGGTATYYLYGEWVYKDTEADNIADTQFQVNHDNISIKLRVYASQNT